MLKEISRTFDAAHRAIRVVVEDDFGNQLPLLFHVANLICFTCGRTLPTHGDGTVDVDASVKQASDEHDVELQKMVTAFTNNGADVTLIAAALAARTNPAPAPPAPAPPAPPTP